MFPNASVKRMDGSVQRRLPVWKVWVAATGACVGACAGSSASAQSTASVSSRAIGPAAPTATPIGGLATRPIATVPTAAATSAQRRVGVPLSVLLSVADAPRMHGGGVTRDESADDAWAPAVRWVATGDRPRWRRDSSVTSVEAWRDLIVSDVVCNGAGVCRERQQRLRARWMPSCSCYAFADAWNRVWRVDESGVSQRARAPVSVHVGAATVRAASTR